MAFTTYNRLIQPNQGASLWGSRGITRTIALIDQADDGVATVAGRPTIANGASDQARCRLIRMTGDVTINASLKWYHFVNTTGGALNVRMGSNAVSIGPGEQVPVFCDGLYLYRMDGVSKAWPVQVVQYPRLLTQTDHHTTLVMKDAASLGMPAGSTLTEPYQVAIRNDTATKQEIWPTLGDPIVTLDYQNLVLGGQDGSIVEAQDGSWIGGISPLPYVNLDPGASARVVWDGAEWVVLR